MLRRSSLRALFLCLAVGIGVWGVLHHPAYREAKYAALSLPDLQNQVRASDAAPDHLLLYYCGRRLNEANRFAEALPILERAALTDLNDARIRDALATAQMATGKTPEAFSQLKQYAVTHPDSAPGHLALGKFYLAMRSGERALEELEKAVTLDATQADGWAALSVARSDFSGNAGGALDAARQAARLRPDRAEDQLRLATLLAEKASPEAVGVFERALRLAPDDAYIRPRFADYLLKLGGEANRARAESEARQSLEQKSAKLTGDDEATGLASQILGRALTRRGADADALAPLLRATKLLPYDPLAPRELAQIFRRRGDAGEAERWNRIGRERQSYLSERQRLLNDALAKPDDRPRCARLAALLAQHGETEEALRYQGLAEGGSLNAPMTLMIVAENLKAGGHAAKAAFLARRVRETASDPAVREKAARLLASPSQ